MNSLKIFINNSKLWATVPDVEISDEGNGAYLIIGFIDKNPKLVEKYSLFATNDAQFFSHFEFKKSSYNEDRKKFHFEAYGN